MGCHAALPLRVRGYLHSRGIPDGTIDRHCLGWDGRRVTIPIFAREGHFAYFKLAKAPDDPVPGPKMLLPQGTRAELYGWERVRERASPLLICEGEFDRLVLEARGFAAVTSTAGAAVFRPEWAEAIAPIGEVYVCFDRDHAGRNGARRVATLLPHARVVDLPSEVGEGGDVTDFFVRLGRARDEFLELLGAARPLPPFAPPRAPTTAKPPQRAPSPDLAHLKTRIVLQDLVSRYIALRQSGRTFVGRCPFHDDRRPSFVVYPETRHFHCFGCEAHGDAITFLMRTESLTFREAVGVLRRLTPAA